MRGFAFVSKIFVCRGGLADSTIVFGLEPLSSACACVFLVRSRPTIRYELPFLFSLSMLFSVCSSSVLCVFFVFSQLFVAIGSRTVGPCDVCILLPTCIFHYNHTSFERMSRCLHTLTKPLQWSILCCFVVYFFGMKVQKVIHSCARAVMNEHVSIPACYPHTFSVK